MIGLAVMASPLLGQPTGELPQATGLVADLQLVDASQLGMDALLVLVLDDDRGFLIEGERNLPAGRGMQVTIDHLPAEQGELAVACRVLVTAVPLLIGGEEKLQPAQRPFTVFQNPSDTCGEQ